MIYYNVLECEFNFELKYWGFLIFEKINIIKIVFVEYKNYVIF